MASTQNADLLQHEKELVASLRAQYLQLVPPEKCAISEIPSQISDSFQISLYNEIFSETSVTYQPPKSYIRRFLKFLIEKLEKTISDDQEIDDSIFSLYSDLLMLPGQSLSSIAQLPSHVTYTLPPQFPQHITLLERRSLLSADGHTGSRTWEASLSLGYYLFSTFGSEGIPPTEYSILELGAGTGFTSILSHRLGFGNILVTDGDEKVCANIIQNLQLNNISSNPSSNISVQKLLWGSDFSKDTEVYDEKWDLIIGGDITYDTRDLNDLVWTLRRLLENNQNGMVVIAATIRNETTLEEFEGLISEAELWWEKQPASDEARKLWYYQSDTPIVLYHIKSK